MNVKKMIFGVFLLGTATLLACNQQGDKIGSTPLDSQADSISYCLGVNYATNIKSNFEQISPQIVAQAINDVYKDKELKISDKHAMQILKKHYTGKQKEKGKANKQKSDAFMKKNKQKEDVQVTESGLQYKILQKGSGKSPESGNRVKVHYKGTLLNGDVFDSSYERDKPAVFNVDRVIPGWKEGIKMMKEGAKWKLFIPYNLAYGQNPPRNSNIEPNSALIFEVELLEVLPKK